MIVQTYNPLGFRCAPNQCTPDYVAYDDFRMFVAYGFISCWLSHDSDDPNADCNLSRPVTRRDVKWLRRYFLDTLETLIVALWKGQFEPGHGDVEGDYASLGIGDATLGWRVRLNDDAIMVTLTCTGADPEALWLHYAAIQNRREVLDVLTEARRSVGSAVWDRLRELVPDEADPSINVGATPPKER